MTAQSSMVQSLHENALTIRRIFDAPPALVFKAWTDPSIFTRWIGPQGFQGCHVEQNLRQGGSWRACIQPTGDPQGCGSDIKQPMWMSGTYQEISPCRRLVFTFAWDNSAGERGFETLVTITFEQESQGKTLMTFHQAAFDSAEETLGHQRGWESCFNRLGREVVVLA